MSERERKLIASYKESTVTSNDLIEEVVKLEKKVEELEKQNSDLWSELSEAKEKYSIFVEYARKIVDYIPKLKADG